MRRAGQGLEKSAEMMLVGRHSPALGYQTHHEAEFVLVEEKALAWVEELLEAT